MKGPDSKNPRALFYLLWLILALIQAGFTELQDDEAYYWVFSKYLSWGYFDHPPLTALLIKAGYALLPNALGLRLPFLLLNMGTLLLIEKLLEKKNPILFYAIVLSVAYLQLAGFMALPDIPLLFFTALFFYCYKKFISDSSGKHTAWLALCMALLVYSKYHGLLVILFTVASHPRLLRKGRAWLAGLIAILLFLPQLYWQWRHDWISIHYQLFESNVNPYKFSFTANYLAGQLLLAGPVAAALLLPAAILYRPQSLLERSLKFNLWGFLIFFLLSSFRGEVEMNWTLPALVPLIVLSHLFLRERPRWYAWLLRLFPISALVILLARVIMLADIIPAKAVREKFHAWKDWPAEMKMRTRGCPVVFSNSYQRASKYWYYSGQLTYSQNHVRDHRNNYDFWPIEDSILGKPVYFLDIYDLDRFKDTLQTPIGTIGYRFDSSFLSFGKIEFVLLKRDYRINAGDSLLLEGKAMIPDYYRRWLTDHPSVPATVWLYVFKKGRILSQIPLPLMLNDSLQGFSLNVDPRLQPGKYAMELSIQTPGCNPTHNSKRMVLHIRAAEGR